MAENKIDKKNKATSIILLMVFPFIVLCYLGFLMVNGPPKQPRLKHLIPQMDKHGVAKIDKNGDTLWHKIPDFTFTNQDGNKVNESIMDSMIVVVDYFFTTCPGICIPMTENLGMVQKYFSENEKVKILSHTVDPETDNPATLKAYAEKYKANPNQWTFLTGSKKELYHQARKGYYISASEGNGGEEDFIHSEKLVLVDMNRNIRGYFDGTKVNEVKKLIESIELLQLEYRVHKKYR